MLELNYVDSKNLLNFSTILSIFVKLYYTPTLTFYDVLLERRKVFHRLTYQRHHQIRHEFPDPSVLRLTHFETVDCCRITYGDFICYMRTVLEFRLKVKTSRFCRYAKQNNYIRLVRWLIYEKIFMQSIALQ